MNSIKLKTLFTVIICTIHLTYSSVTAQTNTENSKSTSSNLYKEILKMDSLLFSAYNNADIDRYKSLISEDIEFFHDKNGLINSKERIAESLKKIAKLKNNSTYSITRQLVKNTLEVHEIHEFGAIQTGTHQFTETNKGESTSITQAKFIHIWKKQDGNWILTKVFSYNHRPIKEKVNPNMNTITLTNEEMDVYLGDYQFAPEFVLSIVREGHKLFGMAQGDKIEIKPYEVHKFLIASDNSKLEFLVDKKNSVIGIEMQTKKGTMKAKKINNN